MVNLGNKYSATLRGSEMEGEIEVTIVSVEEKVNDYGKEYLSIRLDNGDEFPAGDAQVKKLIAIFGSRETDDWIGRTIILYPEGVTINDKQTGEKKNVTTIRIKSSPKDDPKAAKEFQAAQPAKPVDADLDDEMPF